MRMGKIIPMDGQRFAFLDGLKQPSPQPAKKVKKDRPLPAILFDDSIDIPNEGPAPFRDEEIPY
jgi:hypothetical protein